MVRITFVALMGLFVLGLVGCSSSPEEREAEANAAMAEEKVKMMQRYSECLENYEGQKDVAEKCAQYKDAAETFNLKNRGQEAPVEAPKEAPKAEATPKVEDTPKDTPKEE